MVPKFPQALFTLELYSLVCYGKIPGQVIKFKFKNVKVIQFKFKNVN